MAGELDRGVLTPDEATAAAAETDCGGPLDQAERAEMCDTLGFRCTVVEAGLLIERW